jgi:hypothetical protein
MKKPKQVNPNVVDLFAYVHQKSVNSAQIIPVFTLVWDDSLKEQKGEEQYGLQSPTGFLGCPYASS